MYQMILFCFLMIYVDVHISRDMESHTSKCSDSLQGWDLGKFYFFFFAYVNFLLPCNKYSSDM